LLNSLDYLKNLRIFKNLKHWI